MSLKLLLVLCLLGLIIASPMNRARLLGGDGSSSGSDALVAAFPDNDHNDINIHLTNVEAHRIEINIDTSMDEAIETEGPIIPY